MWPLRDLIKVCLLIIAIFLSLNLAAGYFDLDAILKNLPYQSLVVLGLFLLQSLILIIPTYFLVFQKYKNTWPDIGFRKVKIMKAIGAIMAAYLFYIGFSTLISIISINLGHDLPGFQRQEPHLPLFGQDQFSLIVAFILIVIIAPLVEEIFFRGFVLQTLTNRLGPAFGNFLTAALFATIHLEFQSIFAIFTLGLLLNWLFTRFQSIWPSLGFHMVNNALALYLEYYLFHHPELLPAVGM